MDPLSNDSSSWLERFEHDDQAAAQELVDAYYERLVRLARKRLAQLPPQVGDEEGAVISALRSFFSGVQADQFPRLSDENDLWRILATITARKAIRQMRSYWKQSGESNRVDRQKDVQELLAKEPSPADESILVEEYQRRMALLTDPTLQAIARMKLEGCENSEIASRLSIHIRSVQRKLKLIESIWLEVDSS